MAKPENPPAFPVRIESPAGVIDILHGMSLRDHFAGLALVGMGTWCPAPSCVLNTPAAAKARAEWAYMQADAMLSARQTTDREDGK